MASDTAYSLHKYCKVDDYTAVAILENKEQENFMVRQRRYGLTIDFEPCDLDEAKQQFDKVLESYGIGPAKSAADL